MTYQQTLDYLYAQLPMYSRIGAAAYKADLINTQKLCAHLNNPENKFKSIHVAGTNGKGSTSHGLAAIFQSAGYKTGLYTSPHLKSFTERIRINGKEISQQNVVDFIGLNKDFIGELQPSFFELTVGMAFDFFAKKKVDIAIIETGLGGRLDSTNVIIPEISVITNISFDHVNLLGNTLKEIAKEKAGIIKNKIPVVINERQEEVKQVFNEKAQETNSTIFFASDKISIEHVSFLNGKRNIEVREDGIKKYNLTTDLIGNYQFKNIAGIIETINIANQKGWNISVENIKEGLSEVNKLTGLKGRWQILSQAPLTVCDTGHNEAGINAIIEQLKNYKYKKLFWIIGTVNDKDLNKILNLLPTDAYYFFCEPDIPRKLNAEILAEQAKIYNLKGEIIKNVNEALFEARKNASPNDLILIAGSNFIVSELNEI